MKKLSDRHICFIAGSLGQGGAERQLYYMLRALRAAGAKVRVLSLTRGDYWEDKIRALAVEVTFVGGTPGRFARLRAIAAVLRRERPDFVQSQHFFANTYAALAGRMAGVREIGAIRSNASDEVKTNGPVFGPLNLRLPRALIVNSRAAMENAIRRKVRPERLHYLSNVVDTDEFTPDAKSANEAAPLRLLAVGRLIRLKRHDMLLHAAAEYRRTTGPVEITIAGGGNLEGELRQMASELGLESSLRLAGAVDGKTLANLYRAADIFVLTSDYEGTPNALMEAMSTGLPAIATRVGGVPGVIENGTNGLLIEPGNTGQLSAAIADLGKNPERRQTLGRAARERIVGGYSLHSLPGALEEVYNVAVH